MMFSSDFEKDFDSVNRCSMLACLKRYGIGAKFIHLAKILFRNAQSCMINIGFSTIFSELAALMSADIARNL